MPGMDGTGPHGLGANTGLGRGRCRSLDGCRRNIGYGLGFRRGMGFCSFADSTERQKLESTKIELQKQLANVEKRLQEL